MERRTKLTILILIAALVVLALVLLALAPRPGGQPAAPTAKVTPGPGVLPGRDGQVPTTSVTPLTKEPRTQATLEALAQTFAERYGSYSSDGQLDNLRQLEPLVTAAWYARAVAKVRTTLPSVGFYGVTTKALRAEIVALDAAEREAQVVVQTQRSETRSGGKSVPSYQQLTVTLVKEPRGWKVQQADWQ